MATATKREQVARPRRIAGRASLTFVISQDNGGHYLWEIVDSAGNAVIQSGGFTSSDDAERAAHHVHDAARLAHFARRDAESAVVL